MSDINVTVTSSNSNVTVQGATGTPTITTGSTVAVKIGDPNVVQMDGFGAARAVSYLLDPKVRYPNSTDPVISLYNENSLSADLGNNTLFSADGTAFSIGAPLSFLGTSALANATTTRANLGAAAVGHTHGSLSADGKIGTKSGYIVVTGANGAIAAVPNITADQVYVSDLGADNFETDDYLPLILTRLDEALAGAIRSTDVRLTNSRPPTAHAASHAAAGADALTLEISQITGLQTALNAKATPADVTTAVGAVIDAAPAALNTLNELAAALGNDASFASTVTNALAAKAPLASPTFTGTVSGITKTMVGLGNVDNTSDANKPISTATQVALDGKAAALHTHSPSDVTFSNTNRLLGRSSSGAGAGEEIVCTAAGRGVIGAADQAAQQSHLGLIPGTDVQQWNTWLDQFVGASDTADAGTGDAIYYYAWSSGNVAVSALTAFARSLLGDSSASAARTRMGLGTAATANTGDFAAASHTHSLSSLTQSGATTNQVIQWNGTAWVAATVSSEYTLPNATTTTLGGVIVGTGLSVSSGTVSVSYGSSAGTSCQGNDARLSDARTPLSHTHVHSDVGNSPTTISQFTASQNNLSLGTGGIVRISSNAAVNITGLVATSAGDARLLSNVGSFAITLKHADTASTAANRILCVGNADFEIAAGGSAVVYYDGTDSRWRCG